ncbi:alpha/beta fold hydrolase [Sulfurivermis fontis]|uniref:alpha/beta fold hydrolase n=1 Tax=Sulfurivermis fontis TaxID=1972068 RepID=UPI001558534D|nr:alpha/beta hydrolase [Sulfurivermis fontis]
MRKPAGQDIFAWIICLLVLSFAGSTTAAQLRRECMDEPVFQGRVCFHEANREGERTIVMVHGIGGSADDWQGQIPLLAANYHVLALDLPGFGRSDGGTKHYTPDNYAAVLSYLVSQRAHGAVLLVGHSMGAAVTLNYAALYPDRVSRLVVVDVAGILHRLAYNKFLVGNWLYGLSDEPHWSSELLQSFAGKFLEGMERVPFDSEDMLTVSAGAGEGAERRIAAMALLDADFTPLLPRVSAPVLMLWGHDDQVAPLRTAEVLLRRLPRAWLDIIEKSGHVPMRDQPVVFNRRLLAALADELPPPAVAREVVGDADRIGRCEKQRNVHFVGRYRRIELHGCGDVTIRDADVGELYVFESRVNIEHSRIGGGELAVDIIGSDVKMTVVSVQGDVAIRTARSRLDLAAVDLDGSTAAVSAVSNSKAVFSLCQVRSPYRSGDLHGYYAMTPDSPL